MGVEHVIKNVDNYLRRLAEIQKDLEAELGEEFMAGSADQRGELVNALQEQWRVNSQRRGPRSRLREEALVLLARELMEREA
jgi:hypothetical protein